jgi:hypothetical protein
MRERTENPMVEKVARAIHATSFVSVPWNNLIMAERDSYYIAAKSAIKAMREPTDDMLYAGRMALLKDGAPAPYAPINAYQTMIDAALEREHA